MQSLAKAVERSGWMMWPVMAQSHSWTGVPSTDGESTIVDIVQMQEWCAKVDYSVCSLWTLTLYGSYVG